MKFTYEEFVEEMERFVKLTEGTSIKSLFPVDAEGDLIVAWLRINYGFGTLSKLSNINPDTTILVTGYLDDETFLNLPRGETSVFALHKKGDKDAYLAEKTDKPPTYWWENRG